MWFFHTDSERHIEKLLNGYPDGNFKPDNIITKAEVIAVLNRITQNDNNDDAAPPLRISFIGTAKITSITATRTA